MHTQHSAHSEHDLSIDSKGKTFGNIGYCTQWLPLVMKSDE